VLTSTTCDFIYDIINKRHDGTAIQVNRAQPLLITAPNPGILCQQACIIEVKLLYTRCAGVSLVYYPPSLYTDDSNDSMRNCISDWHSPDDQLPSITQHASSHNQLSILGTAAPNNKMQNFILQHCVTFGSDNSKKTDHPSTAGTVL
jgi:hypothetical protein